MLLQVFHFAQNRFDDFTAAQPSFVRARFLLFLGDKDHQFIANSSRGFGVGHTAEAFLEVVLRAVIEALLPHTTFCRGDHSEHLSSRQVGAIVNHPAKLLFHLVGVNAAKSVWRSWL